MWKFIPKAWKPCDKFRCKGLFFFQFYSFAIFFWQVLANIFSREHRPQFCRFHGNDFVIRLFTETKQLSRDSKRRNRSESTY